MAVAITLAVTDSEIQIIRTYDPNAPVGVLNYVFEVKAEFPSHGLFA
jgi:hypothetical protein